MERWTAQRGPYERKQRSPTNLGMTGVQRSGVTSRRVAGGPQDVEFDVARIGGDGGEVALGLAIATRERLDVLFEAGDSEGASRLEDCAGVFEGIAHCRTDFVVAHHDDVVHKLIAHAEGLRCTGGRHRQGKQRQWVHRRERSLPALD